VSAKTLAEALRQHLARQRDVHRALRLALADGERAVEHGLDLLGVAQLVVPLDELAQHAALVEVLLRPVDVVVARRRHRPDSVIGVRPA
jgi:hypothetical protein